MKKKCLKVELNVSESCDMDGWTRNMKFKDTGLIWVPSSPNIPYPETPFIL